MIQKAIQKHFELEKEFLTRDVKIKPLTLFFIDNIDEYRNKDGYIKKTVEQLAKAEIENLKTGFQLTKKLQRQRIRYSKKVELYQPNQNIS